MYLAKNSLFSDSYVCALRDFNVPVLRAPLFRVDRLQTWERSSVLAYVFEVDICFLHLCFDKYDIRLLERVVSFRVFSKGISDPVPV